MKVFSSVGKWLVRLWRNQPLRSTTYTITGAVLAYLLASGLVTQSLETLILTIVGVVLVGGGTEVAHSQVTPVAKLVEGVAAQVAKGGGNPGNGPVQKIAALLGGLFPKA